MSLPHASMSSTPMIRVESLRYTYPHPLAGRPEQVALDAITFEVPVGGCLAVTGPNGCGKTTLALAVSGLAPRLTGGRLSGRIRVAGRDIQAEPPGGLADVLGLVLEDPNGQLFNPTVEDEIAWGLENLGIPPDEMQPRIDRALATVGLSDIPRQQPPQTLSGGQQKRLALAAALALEPQVLILDQPSGGLAPAARTELVAVLRDLRQRSKLTILFTESDPAVIVALADEILMLEGGHIAAQGSPHDLYPALDASRFPGVAIPAASQFAAAANAGRASNGHAPLICLTVGEAIEQAGRYALNGALTSSSVPSSKPEKGNQARQAAIEIASLTFVYLKTSPVLRDLNLSIPQGQFVALTGDNGAGKTTLAKHLIGLLRPTAGRVSILGMDTLGQTVGQLAQRVGFAFQNPEVQIFNPTVRQEIAFGPRNLGLDAPALAAAVEGALRRFELEHLADYPPAALSFSARRLVALAGIAAMNTPILVLDEPTVGLGAMEQARVIEWLAERQREGTTILLITHDMELAARYAERILVMDGGQIVADGPPREVFARVDVLAKAGLEPPFAVQFAAGLGRPGLAADLTPQGAAHAWVEALA